MPLLHISHRRQLQPTDCLAACAVMVLHHLHIQASYETVVKLLRIGPAGAPYRNLQYLEVLGVSVKIEQGDLSILRSHLHRGLPPIAFVSTAELAYWDEATHHAVVVAGIQNNQVYLHDPNFAHAPQVVSSLEFGLAWSEMDEFYALLSHSKGVRPNG